jgi:hypothetical protein
VSGDAVLQRGLIGDDLIGGVLRAGGRGGEEEGEEGEEGETDEKEGNKQEGAKEHVNKSSFQIVSTFDHLFHHSM